MTKKINKDLTAEQKLVLFEDGTEAPGTSELNHEKREGSYHCTNCGEKLFDSNMRKELVGDIHNQLFELLNECKEPLKNLKLVVK